MHKYTPSINPVNPDFLPTLLALPNTGLRWRLTIVRASSSLNHLTKHTKLNVSLPLLVISRSRARSSLSAGPRANPHRFFWTLLLALKPASDLYLQNTTTNTATVVEMRAAAPVKQLVLLTVLALVSARGRTGVWAFGQRQSPSCCHHNGTLPSGLALPATIQLISLP